MGHRLERREWEGSFADIAACIFQQVTQERNTGAEARSRFRAVRQTDSYFILQTVVVISDFERYAFESIFSTAGVAQLGEQQTEASSSSTEHSGGPVFNPRSWHFFPTSEVGDGENTHDAHRKKFLKFLAQFTKALQCGERGRPLMTK